MNVLWLCNIMIPKIAQDLGEKECPTGGWLVGLADDLETNSNLQLNICFPLINTKYIIEGTIGNINYIGFPQEIINPTQYNKKLEKYFEDIIKKVNPDIVHIFGTEYPHTLAMVNACEALNKIDKVVINIQGLCSKISEHYTSGLPSNIIKKYTCRDFIKQDNIYSQKKKFQKRGEYELLALKKVKHVIGRTDWDKACTLQINPSLTYHFCNETLRSAFYQHSWDIKKCEKFSIFISQAGYPIKGFHYFLDALTIIIKKYPNIKVYVAGNDITKKDKLRISTYGLYLNQIIKQYNLNKYISFLGELNEEQMCQQYLKSHVFVSSSVIENSPNSVGEAMLLGVPTISSNVGGVGNIFKHQIDGFSYQYDAPYMLAYYISKIFDDDELAKKFSINSTSHAQKIHNRQENLRSLLDIYSKI